MQRGAKVHLVDEERSQVWRDITQASSTTSFTIESVQITSTKDNVKLSRGHATNRCKTIRTLSFRCPPTTGAPRTVAAQLERWAIDLLTVREDLPSRLTTAFVLQASNINTRLPAPAVLEARQSGSGVSLHR